MRLQPVDPYIDTTTMSALAFCHLGISFNLLVHTGQIRCDEQIESCGGMPCGKYPAQCRPVLHHPYLSPAMLVSGMGGGSGLRGE